MGTDPGIGRSGSCRGCQLVEDNELNREIAQFILEHTGITVVNAENGKEAVEIFKASEQGEFDFILRQQGSSGKWNARMQCRSLFLQ